MKRHKIAPKVKEQIINRIKNDGVSVVQAAKEHGVAEGTIYAWAKDSDGNISASVSRSIIILNPSTPTDL